MNNTTPSRRPGRPRVPESMRRDTWIRIRVTAAEKKAIEKIAHRNGLSLSKYLIQSALAAGN